MDSLYKEHLNYIDSTIIFLKEYKNILEKNTKNFQKEVLSENFYLANINIENLKDSLLELLSIKDNPDYDSNILNEIKEYKLINQNIKEVMPLLIYYFVSKNSFNFDQEDLLAPEDL